MTKRTEQKFISFIREDVYDFDLYAEEYNSSDFIKAITSPNFYSLSIEATSGYEGAILDIHVYEKRLETQEEVDLRVEKKLSLEKQKIARLAFQATKDLEDYKRLKNKLGL